MSFDRVVAMPVELCANVARCLWRDAIDRFVNNTETYFSACSRGAVCISREHRVRSSLAWLVFTLVRDDLEIEHLVASRHRKSLLLRVHLSVLHIGDVEIDVGCIVRSD